MSKSSGRGRTPRGDGPTHRSRQKAARPPGDGAIAQNLLLAKLPEDELSALLDRGERTECDTRELMLERGGAIKYVYFPLSAMVSLLTVLAKNVSIEAMTIGREGLVGLPLFHGVNSAQVEGICQIAGELYRLPAGEFLSLLETSPRLKAMLHRYSQFTQDSMAQSAACNGIHMIEQRCARWLLQSADAVGDRHFDLTQEFFAQMLAVRRSGITTTMGELERRNLIATRYGAITISDREGLEEIACECYGAISNRMRELLM
jgi:CRP-like cAMP-binding protein